MTRQGTARVLRAMLTEDTGRSILDSGDAYGRHWQRNAAHDFDNEPATVLDARWGLEVTHNVYHWLLDRIDYDRDARNMQRRYDRWVARNSDRYTSHQEDIAGFLAYLRERGEVNADGLELGDGGTFGENTYNGPDLLSQTLQYDVFAHAPCDAGYTALYVILQIHGGCDVRGGYTRPRIFSLFYDGAMALLDNARASLSCDGYDIAVGTCASCGAVTEYDPDASVCIFAGQRVTCDACMADTLTIAREHVSHMWYTDDAYHWYSNDGIGSEYQMPSASTPVRDDDGNVTEWKSRDIVTVHRNKLEPDDDGAGFYADCIVIEYDDDGVYCPRCGAQLHAHSY